MNGTRLGLVFSLLALAAPARVEAADPPAKPETPAKPRSIRALAYSPDGKILVAGVGRRADAGAVVAWDVETRKVLWQKRALAGFHSVSFAPDGKAVAVTNWKSAALRFEPSTGRELGEIGSHSATVRACAYIPGTDWLATGGDGVIRLWDVKTGKIAKELAGGHPAEVLYLAVSPDGKWLLSTGPDGTRAWDVVAGKELKDAVKIDRWRGTNGIHFVTLNRLLYSDSDATMHLVELPSGKELMRYRAYGEAIAYSSTLGLAAYNWNGQTVSIMDLAFRAPTAEEKTRIEALLKEFDDDSYPVRVAASKAMHGVGTVAEPMLRKAASDAASPEVRMRAHEVRLEILEKPLRTLKGHTAEVGPMTFSPDGKVLATGADDGTVRLWDPRTGKELVRLDVPEPDAKPRP